MIRRPPRSTLFPYTSSSDLLKREEINGRRYLSLDDLRQHLEEFLERSEEHTSELQSQSNLVCCLLLEKKYSANRMPIRRLSSTSHPYLTATHTSPRTVHPKV